MKVKILGKYGPFPKEGGANSGYLVSSETTTFLLDFGSGVMTKLLAECPVPDGIFISHLHYDHTSDLLPYRYYLDTVKKEVPVYTEKQENNPWYDLLFTHPKLIMNSVCETSKVHIGDLECTFFRTKHPAPTLGIRISDKKSTLVYTGDTGDFDGLRRNFEGADLVLCDGAQSENFVGGHLRICDTTALAKQSKAKWIATHISAFNEPNSDIQLPKNVEIAQEGKEYIF